eukprot:TRINITY_DN10900_c0_g1_i1.p1 TRINITY_DN10900_c0_g1~~TRINITY_DN10900_c0_g1_i1.p1  ORF type:complete len:270 (-),score=26.74 TRINITY_DN10900_c0_g1_i1:90-899(-)
MQSAAIASIEASPVGSVVMIPRPLHVIVTVRLPCGKESLIPIAATASDTIKLPLYVNQADSKPRRLCVRMETEFKHHPVDLLYAITDYKAQSQTLPKLLLDLNRRPGSRQITHAGLYVAVSRVQSIRNLAVLPALHGGMPDLAYLQQLQPDTHLETWLASYDSNGRFSRRLCTTHHEKETKVRPCKPPSKRPRAAHVQTSAPEVSEPLRQPRSSPMQMIERDACGGSTWHSAVSRGRAGNDTEPQLSLPGTRLTPMLCTFITRCRWVCS